MRVFLLAVGLLCAEPAHAYDLQLKRDFSEALSSDFFDRQNSIAVAASVAAVILNLPVVVDVKVQFATASGDRASSLEQFKRCLPGLHVPGGQPLNSLTRTAGN